MRIAGILDRENRDSDRASPIWCGLLTLCAVAGQGFAVPAAAQQSDVGVEVVLAEEVMDREPVNPTTDFPADVGQVVAWTRVTGAAGTTIEHVWRHEGEEWVVPLQIGGSPWRTWSSKTIPPEWSGEWSFEVRDAAGSVVATASFTVGSM